MKAYDLKAKRAEFRVNQVELASEVGLNPATVVDIELGRVDIEQGQYNDLLLAIHRIAERKRAERGEAVAA